VELSDRLAARYGTRSNGEEFTEARRNKYLMQEVVRSKGLRAITQKLCRSEAEVSVRRSFETAFTNSLVVRCWIS